jgi:ABC-type multidrug transport system ATPase subunit
MYSDLTVLETLQFAGKLRLPKGTSNDVIDARARELLSLLGLSEAANTLVGSSTKKGISGGQRKRLAVATELFDRPRVLFLDECTSGLDSASATLLIDALIVMAKKEGSVVVLTIHQPRASLFMQFDKVNILAAGDDAFFGTPQQAMEYWSGLGFPVPAGENPADYMLDTVSVNAASPEERAIQAAQLKMFLANWAKTKPANPANTLPPVTIERGTGPGVERPSWMDQFYALLGRNFTMYKRDKKALLSVFIQTIVIALFLGLVFFNMTDGAGALLLRLLAFFFVTFVTLVVNCFPTVQSFTLERKVLVRERSSNSYAPSAFYFAKLVILFPQVTLSTIIIVCIR